MGIILGLRRRIKPAEERVREANRLCGKRPQAVVNRIN
jgi:hypothetical protein